MIDFDALRSAWRSSANDPSGAASAYLAHDLAATLKRRRDAVRRLLWFAGAALALWAARVVYDMLMGRGDPIDFVREWAVVPLLLVPAAVFAVVLMAQRRLPRAPDAHTPLIESFRIALADNAAARLRLFVIAGAYVVSAPLLAWALTQLGEAGKMAPHEQMSAAIVLGGALALGAAFMALRYVTQLAPERRQLEALLRQYET